MLELNIKKEPEKKQYDVIVLGAGPAGLSAAVYATRYNMSVLVIAKDMGAVAETTDVDNYLGIYPVKGNELISKFNTHATQLGVEIRYEELKSISKTGNNFIVETYDNTYNSKSIIYALGGEKRKLGLKEEKDYVGRGISYCATCDGAFFKDKTIAVVGGANSAVGSALMLANIAKKVYVIYRRTALRAFPALINLVEKKDNIEVIYNAVISKIKGENKVESVDLAPFDSNVPLEKESIALDGIFVEIGYIPNTAFLEQLNVELDEKTKRVKVNKDMSTTMPGLFAAGDVSSGSNNFDQIITAAAEGAIAAEACYKFILGA